MLSSLLIAVPTDAATVYSDLGYPYVSATELDAANYDWGYANCPNTAPNCKDRTFTKNGVTYGQYDEWGYYFRNCTSYVAWKLSTLGVPPEKIKGLGNAKFWFDNAKKRGIPTGSTAAVGAVAVSTTGKYGHVAFVEAVHGDGTITVSEYNVGVAGNGRTWTGKPSTRGFTKYVYFKSFFTSPPPVGSGDHSDFNNDGRDDLAWYESWNNNAVTVLLSNGSNGFSSITQWQRGLSKPDWAGIGDFNNDGRDDLAWYESWNNNGVTVLLSNGSNGFSSVTQWQRGSVEAGLGGCW